MTDCATITVPEHTTRITLKMEAWLVARGFRPVEREVYGSRGWSFDLCASGLISVTNLRKLGIILLTDPTTRFARFKWPQPMVAMVEVKATRHDFRRGIERMNVQAQKSHTHLRILATCPGVVKTATEVPAGWWWVEVTGGVCRVRHRPTEPIDRRPKPEQIAWQIHQIASACDAKTRFAERRQELREARRKRREVRNDSTLDRTRRLVS